MSINHSPSVVTNGLVFFMDANNRNSYKGPPIQNRTGGIFFAGVGTGTGYVCTSVTETVDIPQLGPTTVYTSNIQNNIGISGNCCPSLFQYGGYAVTGSTLYTYGIVYRSQSGYTHPNFMYRYEYNGGSYVTESGVHTDANRISLGNGWWWAWNTFTTQPSTNSINSSGLWYYQYSAFSDKISVAKIFVTEGNYTGLHPKYWPDSNTTRSNTQAIRDLTTNNTVTATSLTYASDGTFSFNGSSNYINLDNNIQAGYTSASYEFWCRPASLPGSGNYFQLYIQEASTWIALYNVGAGAFFGIDLNNGAGWFDNNGGSVTGARTTTTLTANTDYYIAYSWNGSTVSVYLNGNLQATVSTLQAANGRQNVTQLGAGGTPRNIGSRGNGTANNWVGTINSVRFYNRALSAAEVQQNFNATRGRYGL